MAAERAGGVTTSMLGPYRLLHQLGEGGMGVVHLGLDRAGRAVAVKVLRAHIAHDPDARARLGREVSSLRRVQHPLVAEVLDADVDGERPYVVTRYVPGPGLDVVVGQVGPMPAARLTVLGRGLSQALGAIHAAGVVHRDLKPANVLLLDDQPVVIDFGIAHVADDVRLTSVGLVMGTPGYLSPEVVDGDAVGTATDWWGWAATLAFAASGRPPFGRGPMEVVIDRVSRGAHDLEGVDPRLRPLLVAALDVDPGRRPAAAEVLAALDRYAAGQDATVQIPVRRVPAPPAPTPPTPTPPTQAIPAAATQLIGAPATQVVPQAAPTPQVPVNGTRQLPQAAPTQQVPADRTRQLPQAAPTQQVPVDRTRQLPQAAPTQPAVPPGSSPAPYSARPYPGAAQPGHPSALAPQRAGVDPGTPPGPRPPRSPRTGTVLAVLAALVGAAAARPTVAAVVALVLMVVARTVDRSAGALARRRYERGLRRSDGLRTGVGAPWHLLLATLATTLALVLPLVLAVAAAFSAGLVVPSSEGSPASLPAVAAGALVGLLACWWGPGGSSLRRGTRSMVRTVVPAPAALVVVLLLLALSAAAALGALQTGHPTWAPLTRLPLGVRLP